MAKTVGFSRNLTLTWLNKAAELFRDNLSEAEYKNQLTDFLSYEIKSPTNFRKTREILMHIWFYQEDDQIHRMREQASQLMDEYPDYAMALHWGMLLLVYPVFHDLCHIIGRMAEFSDTITSRQLKQKLYDEWGERTTLFHSTDKIVATMKDLTAITAEKPGNYKIATYEVKNEQIVVFMVKAAMMSDGNSFFKLSDLSSLNVLYPFRYEIKREFCSSDNQFSLSNFGGEWAVSVSKRPA